MNHTTMGGKPFGLPMDGTMLTSRRDNSDCLFEVIQKFTLHSEEINKRNQPSVKKYSTSAAAEGIIAVAVNEDLVFFDKILEQKADTLTFEASIDFIVWRRSIILVGLSSSEIVLICPRSYQIKERKKANPNPANKLGERFFVDAFIHSNANPLFIDMLAVDYNGVVYCFENVPLSSGMMDCTCDENTSIDIDIGSIRGTVRRYFKQDCRVISASSPYRNMMFIAEPCGRVSLFQVEKDFKEQSTYRIQHSLNLLEVWRQNGRGDELTRDVQIAKVVMCNGLIFILLSNGKLETMDERLITLGNPIDLDPVAIVHDFVLVCSREHVKMWILYGPPDGPPEETYIGIFSAPSFEMEFSVKISFYSETTGDNSVPRSYRFPSQSSSHEEPFAFFEITPTFSRLFEISETNTDVTLQKLLDKGKFDQAEQLAKKYGKDIDIVWKAKAKSQVSQLVSKSELAINSKKQEECFSSLLQTIVGIRDAEYVCEFCLQQNLPRIDWLKELLNSGMKRATECSSSEAAKTLLLRRKKFYTFEQVFSPGNIAEWEDFDNQQNTMPERCFWFLNNLEFKKCELVWRRHLNDFVSDINLMSFARFFSVLFTTLLASPESVSLFGVIFDDAIDKSIQEENLALNENEKSTHIGLKGMMQLVSKQILSLEREKQWPNGAITFVTNLLKAVKDTKANVKYAYPHVERRENICKGILTHLESLLETLQELSVLRNSYSINISFQNYTQESLIEVVTAMLNELFLKEEIERFLNKFLQPFAARKKLSLDVLFQAHIKSVMSDLPYFISSVDIPYQERIVCLISRISSNTIHLDSVLTISKEWPVPWSVTINDLVNNALQIKCTDRECLDYQKKIKLLQYQVPFRCLLIKYRLESSKVRNSVGIHMALKRIMTQKKKPLEGENGHYMDDCFELIKFTGIMSKEDVLIIKFGFDMNDPSISVDDVIPKGYSRDLEKELLVVLLRNFLSVDVNGIRRMHPSFLCEKNEWDRISQVALFLAQKLDDYKVVQFLKIRQTVIQNLWDLDIIYHADYPFNLLSLLLPQVATASSEKVIADCRNLAVTTYHFANDFLVTAALFFVTNPAHALVEKIWDLNSAVINTSDKLHHSFAENSGVEIAYNMLSFLPQASDTQMKVFGEFLNLLCLSFDSLIEPIARLMGIHRIFETLREKEMPLEKEYLSICEKWPSDFSAFEKLLKFFSTTLMQFGEEDLSLQVFNSIINHFTGQAFLLQGDQQAQGQCLSAGRILRELQVETHKSTELCPQEEPNERLLKLVSELQALGICVNAYALQRRNKRKLLEKLFELKEFGLAAQIALFFKFTDKPSWSSILQGLMSMKNFNTLDNILQSLKQIPELWMLPEFALAWLAVSEKHPGFKSLCPIPLD